MWGHQTLNLMMVGTTHSGIFSVLLHNVVEDEDVTLLGTWPTFSFFSCLLCTYTIT